VKHKDYWTKISYQHRHFINDIINQHSYIEHSVPEIWILMQSHNDFNLKLKSRSCNNAACQQMSMSTSDIDMHITPCTIQVVRCIICHSKYTHTHCSFRPQLDFIYILCTFRANNNPYNLFSVIFWALITSFLISFNASNVPFQTG
jgi:hypothetical protein